MRPGETASRAVDISTRRPHEHKAVAELVAHVAVLGAPMTAGEVRARLDHLAYDPTVYDLTVAAVGYDPGARR